MKKKVRGVMMVAVEDACLLLMSSSSGPLVRWVFPLIDLL
jgi:hypothetical protein